METMGIALFSGAVLGLSVAAPFGPISLVCLQRSLTSGRRHGFLTGFGAATAHAIFATIAITCTGAAALSLAQWSGAIRLFSAAILVTLGVRILFRRTPDCDLPRVGSMGLAATYMSTVGLALSNPMTVLPYLAIASGSAAAGTNHLTLSPWSIPGVLLGATGWYLVLSSGVILLRARFGSRMIRHLNLVAGGALIGFGALVGVG